MKVRARGSPGLLLRTLGLQWLSPCGLQEKAGRFAVGLLSLPSVSVLLLAGSATFFPQPQYFRIRAKAEHG